MATRRTTSTEAAPCAPLTRPRYFEGRLLTARDLEDEQSYHREKRRRLVRAVVGWGIVDGLSVAVDPGPEAGVRIAAGLAIDAAGELIEVPCAQRLALPATSGPLHVVLAYAEEPCDPVPVPSGGDDTGMVASRIRETFRLALEARPAPGTLVLARLARARTRWQLDRRFRRRRLRRGASGRELL